MKTVLLMRHGEACEEVAGQTDFDRSLTATGISMTQNTAEIAKTLGLRPDRVVASSAVRTAQTAALMSATLAPAAPTCLLAELYAAPAEAFADVLTQQCFPDEHCVLIVGHNPGIATLMCVWAGRVTPVPPATVMVFQFETDDWHAALRSRHQLLHLIRNAALVL